MEQLVVKLAAKHRGFTDLQHPPPKEEFKDVTNVIVLSPDHSCAMNFKWDKPISQNSAAPNYQGAYITSYLYVMNLQRHSQVHDLLTAFNLSHDYHDVLNLNWEKVDHTAPIQTIIIKINGKR